MSQAIAAIDRAGFEAAAGQLLAPVVVDLTAYSEVAKFDSDSGASKALDDLHAQDLLRPCSSCGVIARPLVVSGIPNAKGAHQAPRTGKASLSGAGQPFERYVVEFTIGPYLFLGKVTGQPGLVPAGLFTGGMKSFYEYARKHSQQVSRAPTLGSRRPSVVTGVACKVPPTLLTTATMRVRA